MTDKTPEIHLKQLIEAVEFLVRSWEDTAREFTRRPESKTKEQVMIAANLYGAFTQTSMTLNLLLKYIQDLPADASEDDIKRVASQAFSEAGDVWN